MSNFLPLMHTHSHTHTLTHTYTHTHAHAHTHTHTHLYSQGFLWIVMVLWYSTTREPTPGTSTTTFNHSRNKRGLPLMTSTGIYGASSTGYGVRNVVATSNAQSCPSVRTTPSQSWSNLAAVGSTSLLLSTLAVRDQSLVFPLYHMYRYMQ